MTEREVVNAKKRELYRTRKESGLCTMCGKPREATAINITRCEACRAMRKKDYVAKKDFEKYRLKKEVQRLRRAFSLYLLDCGFVSAPYRVGVIDQYINKAREQE